MENKKKEKRNSKGNKVEEEKDKVDEKKYERLIAENERNKRKKKYSWQNEEYKYLKEKLYYTQKDKDLIKNLLYNFIPNQDRGEYWFIITGAKLEYENNKGYYQKLVNLVEKNPDLPFNKTISLDMNRTFPNKPYFKKNAKNLKKLSNILQAFAIRNCASIGYCQGFNYIAAQILLVLDDTGETKEETEQKEAKENIPSKNEEKAFWIFTKIIEDYVPYNFYLKFTGVRTDIEVVHSILVKKLHYIDKNEELKLCINNLVSRCFISLYSEIVEDEFLRIIWDAFFVYGDIILFRAFVYIANVLCEQKFSKYNIESVHEELTKKLHKISNPDLLNYFLLIDTFIKERLIRDYRKAKQKKIIDQNSKFQETFDVNLKCDINSPICLYHNCDISKYSEYKIFRFKNHTKKYDNYFLDKFKNNNNNINSDDKNQIVNKVEINFDDVLMERMKHSCIKEQEIK